METRKIEELKFADYNPRKIGKEEFQKLVNSVKEFGMVEPIVINKDNTIIGGHQRVRAAQELKYKELPVVIVELDKVKEKQLNIALNKIQGEWDHEKLSEILHSFDDIEITGFSDTELSFVEDIAGFGSGGQLDEEQYKDMQGEMSDQRMKLTFYFSDVKEYEELHKFFGGKSDHDKKILWECINAFKQRQV